jgi:heme/copper-type cytochrome/quinol oxidase subunit 2
LVAPALLVAALPVLVAVPVMAIPFFAPTSQDMPNGPATQVAFWAAVAVLAVAQVTLLVAELRRYRTSARKEFPHLTGRAMEILWLVLPVILLAVLLILTWPSLSTGG